MALYLHFPFCTNQCHYCDFYKTTFDRSSAERFFKALAIETEFVFSAFEHEPVEISTIYIGGGTPSLFDPDKIGQWLDLVKSFSEMAPDCEFTIEANPESLSDSFAFRSHELGLNRIVIGVQSFEKKFLTPLNRKQTTRDIYRAFYNAEMAGYKNIAADLIFGLPGQKLKQMRLDIERLTALKPNHISFYQLAVEENTVLFDDVASGRIVLPTEETVGEMYRVGTHLLQDKGFLRYEVSSFARDGHQSKHNFSYWTGQPYIALGPAAHGFINQHRYGNVADINSYIERLENGASPIAFVEQLTAEQMLSEAIMLSLRTTVGIDKKRVLRRFGNDALSILESEAVNRFIKTGYLINDLGFLRLTDNGFLLSDKIIADMLA